MTLDPKTTFFDGNDQGTPGTAASGTYGPIRMSTILDAANKTRVFQSITDTSPPGGAAAGDAYFVASPATGAWVGQDGQIAYLTDNGWAFFQPLQGVAYGNAATGDIYQYDGTTMTAIGSGGGTGSTGTGQTDSFTSTAGTIVNAGNNVNLDLRVAIDPMFAAPPEINAAQLAGLDGDEFLWIMQDNGAVRRIKTSDLIDPVLSIAPAQVNTGETKATGTITRTVPAGVTHIVAAAGTATLLFDVTAGDTVEVNSTGQAKLNGSNIVTSSGPGNGNYPGLGSANTDPVNVLSQYVDPSAFGGPNQIYAGTSSHFARITFYAAV